VLDVREISPGLMAVAGRVDLSTVAEFRARLGAAVDRAAGAGTPVLALDLHGVDLVDATGLGVLLGAHRRARRDGIRLRLVRPSAELCEKLLVSRLYRVLDVEYSAPRPREATRRRLAPS
jgi:anti-sigma B factor antagonist